MPLDEYPSWVEPTTAGLLETDLDNLITEYISAHGYKLRGQDLSEIATKALPAIYQAVEAQVEVAVNARAYAKV